MSERTLELRSVDPRSTDANELVRALSQELAQRYDFADDGSGQFKPADATVSGSGFVVGYADGQPITCGAFRPLEGAVCEFKRMFVRPEFRGRGYSRAVLAELERLAVEAGYSVARLETGDRQPEAIGLYVRAGYRPIPNFGVYVGSERSVCFEKQLPHKERPTTIIRAAQPDDFPQIFPLLEQLWPTLKLDPATMADAFAAGAAAANHFQFCCVAGEKIVGFATLNLRHSLWQQAGIGYVGELVVNEADRGRSHGRALLRHMADFAASRKCSRLELDSGFHRTDSHAMYEHCGMTRRAFVFSLLLNPSDRVPTSSVPVETKVSETEHISVPDTFPPVRDLTTSSYEGISMITCYLRYIIDPYKLAEFEDYARRWIPLVEKFGGKHHGYFLPSEGASNVALALFSFPSFAAYEEYRQKSFADAECQAAFKYAEETRCILSYERSFFRPVFQ